MVTGFGTPMQLRRGDGDRICSTSHNFYVCVVYRSLDLLDKFIDCLLTAMAKGSSWIEKRLFCLLATYMLIMNSGLVFYDEFAR